MIHPIATLCLTSALLGTGLVPTAAADTLDRHIDLAVEEAASEEILTLFAQILECELAADPVVSGEVTMRLDNVRVRTVLSAVCDTLGCRWRVTGGKPCRLVIEPREESPAKERPLPTERIDIDLVDATAEGFFGTVAQILEVSLDRDPGVAGSLSLELEDEELGTVLDLACEQLGCRWELRAEGPSPTLLVRPAEGD